MPGNLPCGRVCGTLAAGRSACAEDRILGGCTYTRTTPDRGGQGKRDPGRQGRKVRMQHPLRRAPLIAAVCLFAALLAAPAANAAAVDPQLVPGNPNCASLGLTAITKFDPVHADVGHAGRHHGHADAAAGRSTGRSTVAVDAVIVKGGSERQRVPATRTTSSRTRSSSTPDNASGGPAGISHIEFCTDSTHREPAAPNPAIVLEKTGATTAPPAGHVHLPVRGDEHGRRDAGSNARAHRPQVRGRRRSASSPTSADTSFDPGDDVELHVHRDRRRRRDRPRSTNDGRDLR